MDYDVIAGILKDGLHWDCCDVDCSADKTYRQTVYRLTEYFSQIDAEFNAKNFLKNANFSLDTEF